MGPRGPRVETVPVKEVLFTHENIASKFKCGRKFEDLIEDLQSGKVNPKKARFLKLTGFEQQARGPNYPGRYFCQNNRRLWCLKQFQERNPDKEVKVRLVIQEFEKKAQIAMGALTTGNCGLRVTIRGSPPRSARSGASRSSREAPQGGR